MKAYSFIRNWNQIALGIVLFFFFSNMSSINEVVNLEGSYWLCLAKYSEKTIKVQNTYSTHITYSMDSKISVTHIRLPQFGPYPCPIFLLINRSTSFYYAYCKTITSIKPRVVLYSVHIKISMELLKCKFFIHIMLNYIAGGFHFILWETEYSSFIKKENIILRSLLLYLMSTTGIKIFPTLRSGFMLSRKNRFYMHRFNRILLRVASRNYTVNEI